MRFVPTADNKEVSLGYGLHLLEMNKVQRLYSDSWEDNEYMYYDPAEGFCFEDNCVIGKTIANTIYRLTSLKYIQRSKFYI